MKCDRRYFKRLGKGSKQPHGQWSEVWPTNLNMFVMSTELEDSNKLPLKLFDNERYVQKSKVLQEGNKYVKKRF